MSILVFEQNSFVRADILETLTGAFGEAVDHIPSLADVSRFAGKQASEGLAILSLTNEEINDALTSILSSLSSRKIVIIANSDPVEYVDSADYSFLQRPFTSDGLIAAVRIALSDPR